MNELQPKTTNAPNECSKRKLIPLPEAPRNTSPVPELTSIHASPSRGPFGKSSYRGNCDGYLIRDLVRYFQPKNVLDPMTGGGTCRDVCRDLDISCQSLDLRTGFDAADPRGFQETSRFDFVWLHPPYWRMVRYNEDERCLSNAATLEDFLSRLRQVLCNSRDVLSPRGMIAILIGGYSDRGRHIPLPALTMGMAIEEGLWPHCTDIIRLQYGNTSSRKTYNSSFIPGLHDVCMILERA